MHPRSWMQPLANPRRSLGQRPRCFARALLQRQPRRLARAPRPPWPRQARRRPATRRGHGRLGLAPQRPRCFARALLQKQPQRLARAPCPPWPRQARRRPAARRGHGRLCWNSRLHCVGRGQRTRRCKMKVAGHHPHPSLTAMNLRKQHLRGQAHWVENHRRPRRRPGPPATLPSPRPTLRRWIRARPLMLRPLVATPPPAAPRS
mmetsp:Transcript_119442/g.381008  ORF Transcript_119442/g.381008 Transcript_119442/m.381008 type:complete len:205 (+) Transcript_119442:403-1017(+)